MDLFSIDLKDSLHNLIKLIIAMALSIPIGWERGRGAKSVGLRTLPIVAIASCGFVIVGKVISNENDAILGNIIQGMLSGIGFIGGGAIIKQKGNIQGIVTAASIWNTGAIGIAIGADELEVAIFLCLINFLGLFFLTSIVKKGYLEPESGLFNPVKEKNGLFDANGERVKTDTD